MPRCQGAARPLRDLPVVCLDSEKREAAVQSSCRTRRLVVAVVEHAWLAPKRGGRARPIKVAVDHRFTRTSCSAGGLRRCPAPVEVQHRSRREQRLGVVVLRAVENVVARAPLDDPAALHHHDADVGDLFDGRESWLMNRQAKPYRGWSRSSNFGTCAWMVMSSAETGSSATTKAGWRTIARAIAIRCR